MFTGNYGFFNLLTLVLTVNLLDDSYLEQVLRLDAQDEVKNGKVSKRVRFVFFRRLLCCRVLSLRKPALLQAEVLGALASCKDPQNDHVLMPGIEQNR